LAQLPNLPRELRSAQVLARFCLRTIILLVFAAFSSIGFGRSFAALLWMAIIFSSIIGLVRREPPFDVTLNHWDETVAYVALFALVSVFNHSAPI
jgi:hypothetical protein